ncbi:EAL domain-containing protein [Terasakiella sp. A23]|uniref:putative bifunctional diguanylate cyclase/phosphodiesterase n=1 Tax=Terasakiella sp. FCG-A23 TaxID=3080561 RepID=UPI002952BE3D|nr:EAL domain-containing protein [Terasakiella sp. A23]MDV7341398.1 EAL domain-containing protein [Terasakiella sp. A23]
MSEEEDRLRKELAALKGQLVAQRRELSRYRMLSSVFQSATQPIALVNANFQVLTINPAFSELTAYSEDEVQYFPINGMIAHHKRQELWPPIQTSLEQEGHWEGLLWNESKTGSVYRVQTHIQSLDTEDLNQAKYVFFFHDVTHQKETEEQLQHRNNYDIVTDLPNWNLFLNRFISALYVSGQDNTQTALLFIGLDGFKVINDTLGYTIGDKLLQEAALRFERTIPESGTIARFSGDQFTAVLPNIQDDEELAVIAHNLLDCLERPFDIEDEEIFISCSIGVCTWPGDGDDVETLLRNADSAMHKAKDNGRNTFHFFTPDIDAKAQAQRAIERDLRQAVKTFDEFHLVYQPIVDMKTGEMKSAEALIRWHSAERGLVSPDQFIPLAEKNHLILPIGEWVLETACREIQDWSRQSQTPFRVSINLSSRQFQEDNLPNIVKGVLDRTGFDPNQLSLEITETLMMENMEDALAMLHELKAMGVRLSIDDFGTGYSSLNYLKRFPLDTLKVDRMFVRDVTTNPEDAAMVVAILTMAKSLGLEVVGEGIEAKDQNDFLLEKGCELGQGYYYSRPLRIEEFNHFAEMHENRNVG